MGTPIAGSFDMSGPAPIDSRTEWTGSANTLNNVPNKNLGLITYVTGDKDLYLFRGGSLNSLVAWEKIVTTNVDSPSAFNSTINLDGSHNGLVLQVNSPTNVNVNLPISVANIQSGYNVTFVQMGAGNIIFNSSSNLFFRNRLGFTTTAGQYAVASILRVAASSDVLLYGDLV